MSGECIGRKFCQEEKRLCAANQRIDGFGAVWTTPRQRRSAAVARWASILTHAFVAEKVRHITCCFFQHVCGISIREPLKSICFHAAKCWFYIFFGTVSEIDTVFRSLNFEEHFSPEKEMHGHIGFFHKITLVALTNKNPENPTRLARRQRVARPNCALELRRDFLRRPFFGW